MKTSIINGSEVSRLSVAIQMTLPKAGWVRCRGGREWEGKIKRATVQQTPTGKYYATVLIDDGHDLPAQPATNLTPLGINVGCKTEGFTHQFAAMSTGEIITAPAEYKRQMKRLRRASRRLARKQKGSANRVKQNAASRSCTNASVPFAGISCTNILTA